MTIPDLILDLCSAILEERGHNPDAARIRAKALLEIYGRQVISKRTTRALLSDLRGQQPGEVIR